jgi:hypothetical protein
MKSPLRRYTEQLRMTSPRSRRLGFIAGYYRLTAVLGGVGLAATLAQASIHWSAFWAGVLAHPLAFASWPFSIATCWWTGELIGQRQRFGAWIAVTSISLGTLSQLAAHHRGASATILLGGALGLAAIASVWKELE